MKEISLKKDNYIEKATESFKNIISSGILKKKDFIPEDLPLFLQILIDSPAMLKHIKPFIKSNKVDYIQLEEFLLPIVGKDTLLTALSQDYKVPAIDLEEAYISPHLGNIIPSDIGKSFFVTCVAIDENGITLAMVNSRDDYAVSQVETKTNFKVVNRFVVLYKDIVDFMDLLYGTPRGLSISPRELVDDIIKRAVTIGASDIHIEPL